MFKIGAQLIIWGQRIFSDFPSVLDEVAGIGYDGIETNWKVLLKWNNSKILLENRGLSLVSMHALIGELYDRENVERILELSERLESKYIAISGIGHASRTDKITRDIEILDGFSKEAKKRGVKVCYHNHDWEFRNNILRELLDKTDSDTVKLCVDIFWLRYARQDPVTFLKRYAERIGYIHLKDGVLETEEPNKFRELGRGDMNIPSILQAIMGSKIKWLVIEQDKTDKKPEISMKISYEYLVNQLKSLYVV